MMRVRHLLILSVTVALGLACASQEKRFDNIYPGMSMEDVRQQMEEGPSRFENIPNTNYSTWYWANKYCVLFREDKVVAKDTSEVKTPVQLGPGRVEEKRSAQCLPPGSVVETETSRTLNLPGLGTITLPKELPKLPEPSREPATPEMDETLPERPGINEAPEAVLPDVPEEAPQAPEVQREDTY